MKPLYQPTELHAFLEGLGIHPKKGFSQNFLIDGNIIRKIVMVSGVQEGDIVLEIGPGPGSLTQALLDHGAFLVAVEKDFVLSSALARLQTEDHRLESFCADIMEFPLEAEIQKRVEIKKKKAYLVANLPYHITTPILTRIVTLNSLFSTLVVMVQDEVAKRMTAQVGMPDYSSLSLFLQFYSQPSYAFKVSPNSFYPTPKVSSAVCVLKLKSPPLEGEAQVSFFQLTRKAFEHRRKMLRSSLKEMFPSNRIEKALESLSLNPMARPEDLSLDNFLGLHSSLFEIEKKESDS